MTIAQYYIVTNDTSSGPYDLVMLVRKIRNGSLKENVLLREQETNITKPANEWPTLGEFFAEKKEETGDVSIKHGQFQSHGFLASLTNGLHFLQNNQVSTIYSGIFVLSVITMTTLIHLTLPGPLRIPAYIVCFIFSHCLLSCFMFSVLRMTRSQPVDLHYLLERVKPALKSLLLSSMLISWPAIFGLVLLANNGDIWQLSLLGLLIFAIPGLYMLTIYAFTPLLVLDQEQDFWEAMELSRKTVMKKVGIENTGVIFALFVINFIAGLCILLPLVIVLPLTTSPLAEMYDEFFN